MEPNIFQYRHDFYGLSALEEVTISYRTLIGAGERWGNDRVDVSLVAKQTFPKKDIDPRNLPSPITYTSGEANIESLNNRSTQSIGEAHLRPFNVLKHTVERLYIAPDFDALLRG